MTLNLTSSSPNTQRYDPRCLCLFFLKSGVQPPLEVLLSSHKCSTLILCQLKKTCSTWQNPLDTILESLPCANRNLPPYTFDPSQIGSSTRGRDEHRIETGLYQPPAIHIHGDFRKDFPVNATQLPRHDTHENISEWPQGAYHTPLSQVRTPGTEISSDWSSRREWPGNILVEDEMMADATRDGVESTDQLAAVVAPLGGSTMVDHAQSRPDSMEMDNSGSIVSAEPYSRQTLEDLMKQAASVMSRQKKSALVMSSCATGGKCRCQISSGTTHNHAICA